MSFSSVDKKAASNEMPIRLCNYVDVFRNREIDDRIDFMEATASEREIERFELRRGDVLITKDSETPEEIAEPSYVKMDLTGVVCGYHLALARPKRETDGRFLYYAMKSPRVRRQLIRAANGVTRFGLTLNALQTVELPLPVPQEQRHIAEVLSTWDDAIERLARQIARKHEATAYLREALVRGALRVSSREELWAIRRLGSFLTMENERLGSGTELTIYSVTRDGLKPQDQHFSKRIANEDLSRHIVVYPGDLALSGLNFWLGSVDVSVLDCAVCISPDYKVFKIADEVDPRYFRHVVRSLRFVELLRSVAIERASVVRKNFDRETFLRKRAPSTPDR